MTYAQNSTCDPVNEINFKDIFNIDDMQRLQDLFSDATGVASIITDPEGIPLTRPSNFCRLCENIINKTGKELTNYFVSDASIKNLKSTGLIVNPCMNGGFWGAGVSINVGGQHIANWLIGQVRNEDMNETLMMQYAEDIGANRADFMDALFEVPVMPASRFGRVSEMLSDHANGLAEKAYAEMQFKIQIAERENTIRLLQESSEGFSATLHSIGDAVLSTDKNGFIVNINPIAEVLCGWSKSDARGKSLTDVFTVINSETKEAVADPVKKVLESGQTIGLTNHTVLISKNGNEYQIANKTAPVKNKDGEIIGAVLVFSDVTEKYKTEKALKESERSKSVLLSNLPGLAYRCRFDRDWTMEFVSEGFYTLTGYKGADILHNRTLAFNDLILPEYRDHLWEVWEKAVQSHGIICEEYKIRTADNQEKWVWEQGIPIYNKDGEVEVLEGLILDITGRKLAEETLHNERLMLSTLIDNIPDAIYTKDLFCRKTLANKTELKYMGVASEDQVIGKNDFEFYPKEFAEIFLADDQSVINTGKPVINREDYIFDENGEKRWLLSSKLPLRNKDNRIIGLLGIGHDITERRKAEEALRANEEKYRVIFENAPVGLLSFDTNGVIVACNESFAKIIGSSRKILTGLNMLNLPNKKMVSTVQKAIDGSIGLYEDIYHSVTAEKSSQVRAIFTPINLGEINNHGGVGIVEDVSERKQAELTLQESEALYRNLMERLPDGIYKSTKDGKFVDVNPAMITMLGYDSKEELMDIDIKTQLYFDPSDRENIVLQEKDGNIAVYRLKKKDGSEFWVEDKVRYSLNEKGEVLFHEGIIRDITERKLAELALQESESLYRNLVEKLPDGVYKSTHDGKFVDVNPAMVKILGYESKEELMGINIKTQLYFDSTERQSEVLDEDMELTGVYRMKKKDGSEIWVEDHGWFSRDKEENILFHEGIMWDVTERKQAELALRESEALYRNLVERLPDGVYKSTHAGKFVDVNPAMIKMLGYESKDELMAIDIKTQLYFKPSDRESLVLQEKLEEMGIYRLKKKDSSEIWVEDHGWYNTDENGKILFHEGIMRDITERKLAEDALKESEEQNRTILQTAMDGFWLVNRQGQLLEVNEAYCQMSGYSAPELLSMRISDLEAIESGDQTRDHIQKIIEQGETRFESRHLRKDGSFFDIEVSVKYQPARGGQLMAFLHDITDRKKKEQELIKAKEKAEESDRLKSAFLANTSHEIRTPMNGILGFADLLKTPDLSGEEQLEYIRIIKKSGERMLNIINDIVDISKIESGQMKVNLSETKINGQTEFLYTFFKPEVDKKGIKLIMKNGLPGKESIITTDKEKVYAILTNLVKNAIKFTSKGSIEFGYTLVAGQHAAPLLKFYVKDTGFGIPADRQQAIFDRFIQADIADSMAFQGAGLGLSISKAFVEMLGGTIWVESQEGKGSSFYFTLPYNAEPEQATFVKPVSIFENDQIKKLKILIAEDDETSEILISMAIRMFGKEILNVRTGVDAVEACRNNPDIDLILMDIKMPVMDGYEATRQIRRFNKKVFILAQTAFGLVEEKEKALEAGCDEYISKPLDIALLRELIREKFEI